MPFSSITIYLPLTPLLFLLSNVRNGSRPDSILDHHRNEVVGQGPDVGDELETVDFRVLRRRVSFALQVRISLIWCVLLLDEALTRFLAQRAQPSGFSVLMLWLLGLVS